MKHVFSFCSFAVICREMRPWCALVTCNNYVESAVSPECTPCLRLSRPGPSEHWPCVPWRTPGFSLGILPLTKNLFGVGLWGFFAMYSGTFPGKVILHSEGSVLLLSFLLLLVFFSPPFFLLGLILSIHWTCILMASSHGLMSVWHHLRSLSELCWFSYWAKENPLFLFAAPLPAFLCQDIG